MGAGWAQVQGEFGAALGGVPWRGGAFEQGSAPVPTQQAGAPNDSLWACHHLKQPAFCTIRVLVYVLGFTTHLLLLDLAEA